jgi:hypothetical protein
MIPHTKEPYCQKVESNMNSKMLLLNATSLAQVFSPQMLPGHQPLWATACHLLQPVKETLMSNKVANSVKQRI